eukprot:TRINITY_DN1401_c2_g1_i2.p1 TRINITY_DN1401_c2_g1~~TRINITY_DN1401_c2_g1_i2.p1  ORF type:complete len:393 (+),score=99.41 TRINITY_DN1401_c2_g1_i2:309-1487(+)
MSLSLGAVRLVHEGDRGQEVPLSRAGILAKADEAQELVDTLAFGRTPPGESITVNPQNEEYAQKRQKVVDHIRKVTYTVARLANQTYPPRTSSVALHFVDTVLHKLGYIDPKEFQTWGLCSVLLAVKVFERYSPDVSSLTQHFLIDAAELQMTELRLLKLVDYDLHITTTWDYLLCWVRVLEMHPRCTLMDLALMAAPTPAVKDEYLFTDVAVKPLPYAGLLLRAADTSAKYGGYTSKYLPLLERAMVKDMQLQVPASPVEREILDALPFSRDTLVSKDTLDHHTPRLYDFVLSNLSKFRSYPPSVLALCCLLVGSVQGRNYANAMERFKNTYMKHKPQPSFLTSIPHCFLFLMDGVDRQRRLELERTKQMQALQAISPQAQTQAQAQVLEA